MSEYSLLQQFGTPFPQVLRTVRITFYLPHDHKTLAPSVLQALNVYRQATGAESGKLTTRWANEDEGDPFPLTPAHWEEYRTNLGVFPLEGFVDDLEEADPLFRRLTKRQFDVWLLLTGDEFEPNGYEFSYYARLPWRAADVTVHSMLSVTVPIRFLKEEGPTKLRELALALAAPLPFVTGHAGLSLSFTRGQSRLLSIIKDNLFQHPGWDVPGAALPLYLGNDIDGVHWLNFLGPPVLEAVGGPHTLRAHLSAPDTTVEELTGGRALISLGAAPLAGDTKLEEPLPAYRELARFLEPWLYSALPFHTFDGFTEAEARQWWRRFLD